MGATNSLKDRFEKLQKTSVSHTEDIVLNTDVAPERKPVQLQASSYPEVHEKVRNASKQTYDWKKQYKQLFHRPALHTQRSKVMAEFEGNIQSLAGNSLIISFTQNQQLDATLSRASTHLTGARGFWRTILLSAQNLHVSSEKNKLHLSVSYETSTTDLKADLRKILEREYLSDNNSIKTYHLAGQGEWVDIILELTPVTNGRRAEEATT